MSWNNSAYTTLGTAMLAEAMSGKGMDFTRAVSGAGTVAASELSEATAVADQRQTSRKLVKATTRPGRLESRSPTPDWRRATSCTRSASTAP